MDKNTFQRYFEFLFRPGKLQLIAFGVLISPVILWWLYSLSFSWLISFADLLIPVYVAAIIVLVITFYLDKKFKLRLKYYSIIAIALLTLYTALSYPIRNWLISKSERQGERIAKLVDEYKSINGHYPDSLSVEFFKDIPKRSYVGSLFEYEKSLDEKKNTETYCVEYVSFGGYLGHYSTERNEWYYTD